MANDELINQIADKLQNHASEVNPQMWQAVSSQIGAAGASGATALGIGKVAALVIGTTAVAVASYFAVTSSNIDQQDKNNIAKVVRVEPTETKEENTKLTEQKTVFPSTIKANDEVVETFETETVKADKKPVTQVKSMVNEPIKSDLVEIEVPVVNEPIRTIEKTIVANRIESSEVLNDKKEETRVENIVSNEGSKPDEIKADFGITKLPNVFSPNNDGVNDYLTVETKGLSNYSLVVLDRNNNKVWQTTQPNVKWDGRDMSGQFVAPGDYIYFVAADGPNGEKIGKYQRLTITK